MFALHPVMQEITPRVILRTVFGVDETEDGGALKAQIERAMHPVGMPGVIFPIMYLSSHPKQESRQPWRYLLRHRDRLVQMLRARIAERRAQHRWPPASPSPTWIHGSPLDPKPSSRSASWA